LFDDAFESKVELGYIRTYNGYCVDLFS